MFVEYYYPGISLMGRNERKVTEKKEELCRPFPENAYAFRFFEKDDSGNKINFSDWYYIGKEYTEDQYKLAYPQGENLSGRIVKLVTGGFIAIAKDDFVVA